VKANIGHCHLHLGDEETAADWLDQAVGHAPEDPKAAANAVLALTLRGKNQEASDLATAELAKDPVNVVMAAYAVQAAGLLGIDDVLSAVRKYEINHLRSVGDIRWRSLALEGLQRCPDDDFYQRHSAEGQLESVLKGNHERTWLLSHEDRRHVQSAAQTLQSLWTDAKAGEVANRQDNIVLCLNAASAFMLLGEFENAETLIEEGLSRKPEDVDLLIKAAAIALEKSDGPIPAARFDPLPSEGIGLMLKIQSAAHNANWTYLAALHGHASLATVPPSEIATVETLAEIAQVKLLAQSGSGEVEERLSSAIAGNVGAGRPLVLLAQLADELSLAELAKVAYDHALAAVTDSSHIADRQMLARYASRRRDHATVIRLLDGYVETSARSDELLELASAFAYQFPPKARGLGFFTSLPASVRDTSQYLMLEGILHYHRGDLVLAEERLRAAVAHDTTSIRPLLMLAQTLLRQKKRDTISALVSDLDPFALRGSALDRIHLAHLLRMSGRLDDALKLGFSTFEANRNEAAVNLKWLGLTFGCLSHLQTLSAGPLTIGKWVTLSSDDGQTIDFTMVASPGKPAERKFDLSHALAARALGRSVGDSFVVTDGLGRERRWSLNGIEHEYLHSHRDVSENFNERFPDENGFWIIKSADDDLEPFLDVVRQHSERQERLLEQYTRQQIPISVLAEISGSCRFR
jgi:tetratricopeptide (TPR) repeat protein